MLRKFGVVDSNGNMTVRHDKVDQADIVKFTAELLQKLVAFRQDRASGNGLKVSYSYQSNILTRTK